MTHEWLETAFLRARLFSACVAGELRFAHTVDAVVWRHRLVLLAFDLRLSTFDK
jgi:hypothetical protein